MIISYYVTANRRSPFVAIWDKMNWPSRSGLVRSCNSGVLIGHRMATADEIEANANAIRYVGIRFNSIRGILYDAATVDVNKGEELETYEAQQECKRYWLKRIRAVQSQLQDVQKKRAAAVRRYHKKRGWPLPVIDQKGKS